MATLTTTLTLSSTDATSDRLNLSVSESLTTGNPAINLARISIATGAATNILTSSGNSSITYVYIKNTNTDSQNTNSLGLDIQGAWMRIGDGFAGGDSVRGTMNIQFETITPCYDVVTPSPMTSTKASIRTVTGTSVSGTENSFVDNGYEPVALNRFNKLNSVRIVASKTNENEYYTKRNIFPNFHK